MTEHEERVALVTGSGKGVGAGIVKVLCRKGFRCVINCNTNRAMAEDTLKEIKEAGGEACIIQADISDPAAAKALAEETVARYGRLDLLVNNAAMQYNLFIDQYTVESLRKIWTTNAGGYWRMIRNCRPYLKQSPMGRIVNISSVHAKRPTCFAAGYAMTKGAVRMLTREAALELAEDRIPVNAIELGACQIEFKTGHPVFLNFRPPETMNPEASRKYPLVYSEEVGELVYWLADEAGSAMNGSCIRMDRGQMLS